RRVGVPLLSATPHHPLPKRELLELPLPAHWPLPFPFHPCYSLALGAWYFRLGLRLFRRAGAPLLLLFHLTDFAAPLAGARLPDPMARIYRLSPRSAEAKLRRCERMLEIARRDCQFVGAEQLLSQTVRHADRGLRDGLMRL